MAYNNSIQPISLPFSGHWWNTNDVWSNSSGNVGTFATFNVNVGTPPRTLQMVPTWQLREIMVSWTWTNVTPSECNNASRCSSGLNSSNSNTWRSSACPEQGLLEFDLVPNSCGYDQIEIDLPGAAPVVVPSQQIEGLSQSDGFTSTLGLNPRSYNNSNDSDASPHFLRSLKSSQIIPSLSVGRSYGVPHDQNRTPSLILGGYDASNLVEAEGLSFKIDRDDATVFVQVEYLSFNSSWDQETQPFAMNFMATIGDMNPYLSLPVDACRIFESAFGLLSNPGPPEYVINKTQHTKLITGNASVTFMLGNNASNWQSKTDLTVPYASIMSEAGISFLNASEVIFPLSRLNGSQFSDLGMPFLRQVYVIADFERQNVTIYPKNPNPGASPQISAIPPLMAANHNTNISVPNTSQKPVNVARMTAGTATGVVSFFLLGMGIVFCLWRRRRNTKRRRQKDVTEDRPKPEMEGTSRLFGEFEDTGIPSVEIDGNPKVELQGSHTSHISVRHSVELEGDMGGTELTG